MKTSDDDGGIDSDIGRSINVTISNATERSENPNRTSHGLRTGCFGQNVGTERNESINREESYNSECCHGSANGG